MNKLVWRNIGRFVLLMLVQMLVLNHVYMGGYIVPMLYVLFVLMLPTSMGKVPMLLAAFGSGLLADVMAGPLGFNALGCTVVAMCRVMFADRILTRGDDTVVAVPSLHSVAPLYFVSYLLLMFGIFYLVFFTVEMFGFRGFGDVLLATLASTLASTALALVYQFIFTRKEATA